MLKRVARAALSAAKSTTKRDVSWAVIALATFGLGYFHGKPGTSSTKATGQTFQIPLPYACELTRSQREQIPHQWHESCPECRQAKVVDQLSQLKPPSSVPATKRKVFTADTPPAAEPKSKTEVDSPSDIAAKIKTASQELAKSSKPKVPVTGVVEISPPPFGSEKVDPVGKPDPNGPKIIVRDDQKKAAKPDVDPNKPDESPILVDTKEYRVEVTDGKPGWEVFAPKDTQVWMDHSLFIGYVPGDGHMSERYETLKPWMIWKQHPLTFVLPGGKTIRLRVDLDGAKRTIIRIKK